MLRARHENGELLLSHSEAKSSRDLENGELSCTRRGPSFRA